MSGDCLWPVRDFHFFQPEKSTLKNVSFFPELLFVCTPAWFLCAPQRSEEGVGLPRAGVSCLYLSAKNQTQVPLKEQKLLLTTEPSL